MIIAMKERFVLTWVIFLMIAFPLMFGCAGKGKDLKTIKGDPEILYRQGLERFNKRDYPKALKIFEQIKSNFPDSPPYTQWAEIKVGDSHFFKKDYVEAIAAYEEFRKTRPTHEDIPYVQYQIGQSYFEQMRTFDRDQTATKKALSNFEYLVANTPPSIFTEKALEKIEVCKQRLADHELYIATFYYKRGKHEAAVFRLEGLQERFPKRSDEDRALYLLGKSYLELDQWEKAKAAFTRIVNEYPKSSHYREAKSILDQGENGKGLIRKAKARESRKKTGAPEGEPGRIALLKFDEEKRRPVPFQGEAMETKIEEKKAVSSPPDTRVAQPAVPPVGETREISPPLVKYEEEKRQPIVPSSPPPKELPPAATPESRDVTKEREGLKEEPPQKKEVEKVTKKEREISRKEIRPESEKVKLGDPGEPIDITSDRVETFAKENLIIFKGNVMVRQKDMIIYSDSLEALIFEDGKGIEKVVAGGNVKIQQGVRVAHCQKAVFFNRDQKVVLTGNPQVWEGGNMVSGEEIIFDIEKNRVEVKGGPAGRGKVKVLPGGEFDKAK